MKPFNFKQHQTHITPTIVEPVERQSLGRLFRVRGPVHISFPPPIEEQIAERVKSKILALGDCGESTGVSLHPEGLDK